MKHIQKPQRPRGRIIEEGCFSKKGVTIMIIAWVVLVASVIVIGGGVVILRCFGD